VVSWFPAITETFILDELRELRARGVEVEVLPLFGARGGEVHAGFAELRGRTHYHRTASWELLLAQLHWLRRRPAALLRAWVGALRATASSRKLLLRAPAVLLKAALVARRAQGMEADHLHAHWATHPALAAWAVRELTGIPFSFTAHAHDLYVDRAMLREKVAAASFVVTISEFNRRLLEQVCGPAARGKVQVIRCGVDLGAFALAARIAPEVPTFACVASLRPYKGHGVLLDAVTLLKARGVALRVVLVGAGELRAQLAARIARDGLGDVVELRGALAHEEIPAVLARATAMVLPSVTADDCRSAIRRRSPTRWSGSPATRRCALASRRALGARWSATSIAPATSSASRSSSAVPSLADGLLRLGRRRSPRGEERQGDG